MVLSPLSTRTSRGAHEARANNSGTVRVPRCSLPLFSVPCSTRTSLKLQIKVLSQQYSRVEFHFAYDTACPRPFLCRVPAAYLNPRNLAILAFLAFLEISKLRVKQLLPTVARIGYYTGVQRASKGF